MKQYKYFKIFFKKLKILKQRSKMTGLMLGEMACQGEGMKGRSSGG